MEQDRITVGTTDNKIYKKFKPADTKLKSKDVSTKIVYPFTLEFVQNVFSDMLKVTREDPNSLNISTKIQMNSQDSEYYEILIHLIQADIERMYHFTSIGNITFINELVAKVKENRIKRMKKNMKLTSESESMSDSESTKGLTRTEKNYLKKLIKAGKYVDNNGVIQNITSDNTVKNAIQGDMKYSMYTPAEHEYLGTYDQTFTNAWDNDYVLLNTDKWKPRITHETHRERAKKIASGQICGVSPMVEKGFTTKGTPLKQWDIARKVLPPDEYNLDFIREKLMTGKP
jgi:hypothetical protein